MVVGKMQILHRFLAVSPPIVRFSSAMFAHFVNIQMLFSLSAFFFTKRRADSHPPLWRGGGMFEHIIDFSRSRQTLSLSVFVHDVH